MGVVIGGRRARRYYVLRPGGGITHKKYTITSILYVHRRGKNIHTGGDCRTTKTAAITAPRPRLNKRCHVLIVIDMVARSMNTYFKQGLAAQAHPNGDKPGFSPLTPSPTKSLARFLTNVDTQHTKMIPCYIQ